MATEQEKKEAFRRWQEHSRHVERITSEERTETEAERRRNVARSLKDYGYFCQRYLAHYCQCPNAPFHNEAARYIAAHRELRLVCKWPRGHAKSVHLDIGIPLWLKFRGELHVMVLVGKSEDSADGLLGDLQTELQYNNYIKKDFGEQYNSGMWQEGEFVTKDQCAFFSRGRGQSPRGLRFRESRPDYIVVDDLDDDEMCRSEARVRAMTDWIKEALFGCFGGNDGRFIMVGNLIEEFRTPENHRYRYGEDHRGERHQTGRHTGMARLLHHRETARPGEVHGVSQLPKRVHEQSRYRRCRVPAAVDQVAEDAQAGRLRAAGALHRPELEIDRKKRLQRPPHSSAVRAGDENSLPSRTASYQGFLPSVQSGRVGAIAVRYLSARFPSRQR